MLTHAVRVLLTDTEGRALLHLRRDDGQYVFCFFGGKVEPDEECEAAALREIHEEAGLTLNPAHLHYLDTWTNDIGVKVLHYKYALPVRWEDVTYAENYGVAMVPYADLPSIPLAANMLWFYQQYPQLP